MVGARTGKNLFPQKTITLGKPKARTVSIYFASPIPTGVYTFSWVNSGDVTSWGIGLYGDKGAVGRVNMITGRVAITDKATRAYLYISQDDYDNNKTLTLDNMQCEIGSTATTYEEYTVEPISVSWATEAGTVYGGTLNVITGELTVDRGYIDLGSIAWRKIVGNKTYFRTSAEVSDMQKSVSTGIVPNFVCSCYRAESWTNALDRDGYDMSITEGWGGKSYVAIYDSSRLSYSEEDFKTAMSGVQLVYDLATPIVYQLDPVTVNTLLGTNNIWTDTGDVTVTYIAKSAKFSFHSPLHTYNYNNLKLFGNTYIEHGKG